MEGTSPLEKMFAFLEKKCCT